MPNGFLVPDCLIKLTDITFLTLNLTFISVVYIAAFVLASDAPKGHTHPYKNTLTAAF